jgi:hypothetical protein
MLTGIPGCYKAGGLLSTVDSRPVMRASASATCRDHEPRGSVPSCSLVTGSAPALSPTSAAGSLRMM